MGMSESRAPGSDAELWVNAMAGDAEAFGLLFDRYAPVIHRFCLKRAREPAIADDLVSVVFLETWRRREDVVVTDSLLPWLIGVASNAVLGHDRARRRYRKLLSKLPAVTDEPDPAEEVVGREVLRRESEEVHAALAQLNRRDRELIRLCLIDGQTYEAAAQSLGIPVGTVKSRLSRLRAKLSKERSMRLELQEER